MALVDGRRVVLALDTSSDMLVCGVAAVGEAADCDANYDTSSAIVSPMKKPSGAVQMLSNRDHLCRRQANVELVSTVQQALADANLSMADVDSVLVGRGPGSFTGVRIGIATAKGLACGAGTALWGGSTLDGVAWTAWKSGVRGKLGVVADAMRSEVYPGIYQLDDTGAHRLFGTEVVRKAALCVEQWSALPEAPELTVCGDCLVKHRAQFEQAGFTSILPEELWRPTSEGLLLAYTAPDAVKDRAAGDPALVLPVYTRLSDAEENERKRLGMQVPASVALTGTADVLAGMHLQLRPMSINDIDQVAALDTLCFHDSVHKPWTRTMFEEELSAEGRSWWVAHDMDQIIGVAGGMLVGDDMEIATVDVAPHRRREKIASRLIARLAYDAQMLNAQSISLEVYEHNTAALALYVSMGFVQEGVRPNYYGPGNAAHIMRATLPLSIDAVAGEVAPEPQASIRPWPIVAQARSEQTKQALAQAGNLILAIESSCDETAMAIMDSQGHICANVVATSIDFHARFGGVVPEIASRKHVEAIVGVFEEVMAQAGEHFGCDTLEPSDLSAVGVTAGPGLVGALVVGVAFAKGVCAGAQLPLIAVHHLEGHLLANLFETPDLKPPFVASLVYGGNTMLVHVRAWGDYHILGTTIDDAVGEAFDKVAKALGLGYPGGPVISKLAASGNKKAIHFPRAMMHSHDYRFSLSGLKTSVITYIENQNKAGNPINLPDLAASFEAAVIDVQVAKALAAVEQTGVSEFCVGGGVAANPALRAEYQHKFGKRGVRVTVPPLAVCGDNGAMIAAAALRNFYAGQFVDLTLDADPNAALGTWSSLVTPVVQRWKQ